jgi:hypothetical protein
MVRVPSFRTYHHIAVAEGQGDNNPPAKTGVPSQAGTPAAPVDSTIPVDANGPAPQAAPLPNADAPASQGLSVPQNQVADTAPGLTDIEFAELKSIFEYLQKTSTTRGPEAKPVYKEAAKAIWQKSVASKVSAQQRAELNKIPPIR